MRKEEINLLAQLLSVIKDAISKLEEATNEGDMKKAMAAKREILNFQKEVDKML